MAYYPGQNYDVRAFFYEKGRFRAFGHENMDTEPGLVAKRRGYSLEFWIVGNDQYQIKLLQIPEASALISVTFPNITRGTGFPAPAFAILPDQLAIGLSGSRQDITLVRLAGQLRIELDLTGSEQVFESKAACIAHHGG